MQKIQPDRSIKMAKVLRLKCIGNQVQKALKNSRTPQLKRLSLLTGPCRQAQALRI